MKEKMLAFLQERFLCVVSTVTADAKPEAAYVGFTCNEKLEIIIGTSNLSRKYANLQANPSIALVVADLNGEVQYEGQVSHMTFEDYDKVVEANEFRGLPNIEKFRNDPTEVFFRIRPTWIRFIEHGEINTKEEFTEFA